MATVVLDDDADAMAPTSAPGPKAQTRSLAIAKHGQTDPSGVPWRKPKSPSGPVRRIYETWAFILYTTVVLMSWMNLLGLRLNMEFSWLVRVA